MDTAYNWFNLFNETAFLATGLTSRTLDVILQGIGEVSILISSGNATGVLYQDTFLLVGLNDQNPYVRDGLAIYKDENSDIWLGVEVAA